MKLGAEYFKPLLIRASAGSGKTFALSSRYIALLAAGEHPGRILATTFTRKAAGEIHARVFQRLALSSLSEEKARELSHHCFPEHEPLGAHDCARLLARLVAHQHQLHISTLDSFFYQVASAFSLELGLVPGWTIEDTLDNSRSRRRAIQRVCHAEDVVELAGLVRLLQKGDAKRSMHTQIERDISDLYELARDSEVSAWNWLSDYPRSRLSEEALSKLALEIEAYPVPTTGKGTPHKNWERALRDVVACVRDGDWKSFIESTLVQALDEKVGEYSGRPIPEQVHKPLVRIHAHARTVLLERLHHQTLATLHLASRYGEELELQKARTQKLGFQDLKWALARAALTARLDELYYRLDTRIRHVLLDEFQDTSRAEWMVLKPMLAEILSKSSGEHSFFCVGDTKQAIYGWRGGVAQIFNLLQREWPHIENVPQEESFRSAPPIIDTVNRLYGTLLTNPALTEHGDATRAWSEQFNVHTTRRTELPGYVQLLAVEVTGDGDERSHGVVQRAAEVVRALRVQAPHLSIGVLVRRNEAVKRIVAEFTAPHIGIEASEEGGNPLTDSPAVQAILSLLRLIDYPADSIARFHVARSPLGALLDFKERDDVSRVSQLGRMVRTHLIQHQFGECLYRWAKAIAPWYSDRDYRRLMQLVELGYAHDRMPVGRVSDFVTVVQHTKVSDPSSESVRVMTIHQAKGLEFDLVILPELDHRILNTTSDVVSTYYTDRIGQPKRVVRGTSEAIRSLDPRLIEMHDQGVRDRCFEALSLLYVALTRARQGLWMLIEKPSNPERYTLSFAGILRGALGEESGVGQIGALYEAGDRDFLSERRVVTKPAQPNAPMVVKLKPSLLGRRRALIRQTPSALEGGAEVNLREMLRLSEPDSAVRGVIMHKFFEQIEWLDQGVPSDEELQGMFGGDQIHGVSVAQVLADFRRAIGTPAIAELFKRSRYGEKAQTRVFREHPFAVRLEDSVMRGTFDRLVLAYEGRTISRCEVIDFKSDSFADRSKAAVIQYYLPQMEAYRSAAAQMYGVHRSSIGVFLAFAREGQVEQVI